MAEIGKNTVQPIVKRKGQILKTVSSPSTSGSKKQVTNIVLDNGVLKASSDNGDTFEDITVKTAQNAQGAYIKPSTGIPESDLASAVQTSLAKADTAYQKPSGGIPKNDLAQDVQTSLGKADTALQSVPIATSTKVGGVKPASKTTEMTQSVGVDGNGALWTAPGGGGGITNAQVIEKVEQLPTATADSPDFVQTPDGTLYRKKAVESTGGGASVSYEYVAVQENSENVVIGETMSPPVAGKTYIQCSLSGNISSSGNYYFVNCTGSVSITSNAAKVYVTDSPNLTVGNITSSNWRNIFINGKASYPVYENSTGIVVGTNYNDSSLITYMRNADKIYIYTNYGNGIPSIGDLSSGVNYCGLNFVAATGSNFDRIIAVGFTLFGSNQLQLKRAQAIEMSADGTMTYANLQDLAITKIVCEVYE